MTRALKREVERLGRTSGWREAEEARVEAARKRQRTRFEVIQYELLFARLVPRIERMGQDCSRVRANYKRARQWLDEEDSPERWRADHELLVAREVAQYGCERDTKRKEGWGADRAEMIDHFVALWERFRLAERRSEERRRRESELWRVAPDGQGVMSENAWREKHRARLDRELVQEEPTTSSPMIEEWRAEAERERRCHIRSQDHMSA